MLAPSVPTPHLPVPMPIDPSHLLPAWYLPLRHAHIGLATASVTLFAARGLGVLAGGRWPMRPAARGLSVAIDVLLLNAGVALWWLLQLHPARDGWLGVKLLLLLAYIGLGSFALKRAVTRPGKAVCFGAALACAAAIVAIARAHDPAGALRWLGLGG